jgi:integrase
MKLVYFVKRPRPGRATFAVIKRERYNESRVRNSTVRDERIDAINKAQKTGALATADAELQVEAICKSLNEEARKATQGAYVASEANLKLLKKYWENHYEQRKIIGKESAWNRLRWAVEFCATTSLLADRNELQRRVDKQTSGNRSRQRRAVGAINQIRRAYGIKDLLVCEKTDQPDVHYLRYEELLAALVHVDNIVLRKLFMVLFSTGVRTGEAFSLRKEHYRKPVLSVLGQIDREGVRRETKTRRQRKTVCLPEGHEAITQWLSIPEREREIVCRNSLSRIWKEACRNAFPDDERKHLCVHDLRHSFAIHMLTEKGVSISLIAKLLGNSVMVCERYYLQFVFEDDTLAAVLPNL